MGRLIYGQVQQLNRHHRQQALFPAADPRLVTQLALQDAQLLLEHKDFKVFVRLRVSLTVTKSVITS